MRTKWADVKGNSGRNLVLTSEEKKTKNPEDKNQ
jgi:hypothetical protein